MQKAYEEPKVEVVYFETEDIITTSGDNDNDNDNDNDVGSTGWG